MQNDPLLYFTTYFFFFKIAPSLLRIIMKQVEQTSDDELGIPALTKIFRVVVVLLKIFVSLYILLFKAIDPFRIRPLKVSI
ncbi:hypothetical protein [Paenibacillus elgii]|uniref:hypothetical protein n=1 Tax=Paenibacillus elgii TaxID=189691 RepID=UPI002040DAE5|nr:hypothetical protein [Paenibacillus elgii]MCM3274206.1 hypothetical protein [Paenibacillus elgii]